MVSDVPPPVCGPAASSPGGLTGRQLQMPAAADVKGDTDVRKGPPVWGHPATFTRIPADDE